MVGLVSFIAILGLLIFVHELGHFVTAKLSGVRVEEFGFGLPPRLLTLSTWRGMDITLNALPLGGFVRMSEDDPTVEGGLASKGRGTRALVFAAGALMNMVLAVVLYSIVFMSGIPIPTGAAGAEIVAVVPRSPAAQAGFETGDIIVAIDSQQVQDHEEAIQLIRGRLGQPIQVVLQRNGRQLAPITVTPRVSPPSKEEGALGVALSLPHITKLYPLWEAVPLGLGATYRAISETFAFVQAAIRKQTPFQVSGPVGIYSITSQVARTNPRGLVELAGLLSINLAIVNLLPLPALDGGRLVFVVLEWLRRGRRIPPEKEGLVHLVGMVVLLSFMLVVTFFDFQRIFNWQIPRW